MSKNIVPNLGNFWDIFGKKSQKNPKSGNARKPYFTRAGGTFFPNSQKNINVNYII